MPGGDPTVWARPANSVPPTQPAHVPPTGRGMPPYGPPPQATAPPPPPPSKGSTLRRLRLRDPLSIVLILVIFVALVIAGLLGTELYVRHEANSRVTAATECVTQDKADVSFGVKPFLLQRMTGQYGPISITTAGNRIKSAKGMKAQVNIDDVRLDGSGNSKGTIGALDAAISWTSDGIMATVHDAIPLFGSFLSGVKTNPSDGTIELQGGLGSITAKPQVVNNAIQLQVVNLTGLGFTLPSESVQPALDAFTNDLANNFPMGIHADSVQVTETGVAGHFLTRNATIPQGSQDPCFAKL
jgi:LmeA-like phospholipid-binding